MNSIENFTGIGPFGIGWQDAYDIRMEEAQGADETDYDPIAAATDTNFTNRTDFFGQKMKYHRDAKVSTARLPSSSMR